MDQQFHLDDHPEFYWQLIMKTMTRVLKVQGAQNNTSCVKVAEMEKEEGQEAEARG